MNFVGIDIGSLSAKAVILCNGRIGRWALIPTSSDPVSSAQEVMDQLLRESMICLKDIDYVVSTGYGRGRVPFASRDITEISCHAKGTHWLFPCAGTVLDMGGQDCKVVAFDAQGRVTNFLLSDRCAAGAGRYLERVAATLGIQLDEIGPRSLETVEGAAKINSTCTVFAQMDILRLLQEGKHPNDILAGACDALVKRIATMIERVGINRELSISGGIAKNVGIVKRLEDYFQHKTYIFKEPQIVGAIGAALFAQETILGREETPQASLADGGENL